MTGTDASQVLVAGGGIGGIAAALALVRRGFRVKVLEQAAQLGEIGAGIQLGPNGFAAFDALGIGYTSPDSKASRNPAGIGSKNDAGITMPVTPPIVRGSVRVCSTARSSATGWFRLQIITRSPFATASRYSDNFALAS